MNNFKITSLFIQEKRSQRKNRIIKLICRTGNFEISKKALLSVISATCYDGNNGGCSHTCSGSVCSCPPCWTLGPDEKTCQFEAGKAQVTCLANGAEITLSKCALPGVDPNTITMNDATCVAVEENAETWKISAGFSNCGTVISMENRKLLLGNTLKIGEAVVNRMVVSGSFEIAFSCSYNNVASASKAINAVNLINNGVTFDINAAQPTDFAFTGWFGLEFYESDQFTTVADLSNGAFKPGSPLFGKVAPTSALPAEFKFSVTKCTVEDSAISQSFDILDRCPVEGPNFKFKGSQSDPSEVKFSFMSFIFPTSACSSVIDVSCEATICE